MATFPHQTSIAGPQARSRQPRLTFGEALWARTCILDCQSVGLADQGRTMEPKPNQEQLEETTHRAEAIAQTLKTREVEPVAIEFAGSPKSGKTTTIEILEHFFKRTGFNVWAPSEGASKRTPYHLRRDLVAYNSWTLNYAISELLVAYHNVDRPNLIILDRGPFDSLAWMGLLRDKEELPSEEFETIREFALHPKWSQLIARLYLFTCPVDVSLQRETQFKLTTKEGTAMNPNMLADLLTRYETLREELNEYPVYPVQTSNDTRPLETSHEVAQDVLSVFEARLA